MDRIQTSQTTEKIDYGKEFVYSELSFSLNGLAFKVFKSLGYGQKEKAYCDAFEILLKEEKIAYQREFYCPVMMNQQLVCKNYFDFYIDHKIILEIKVGDLNYKEAYGQLLRYIKTSNVKLGIIMRISKYGVKVKRIPNLY